MAVRYLVLEGAQARVAYAPWTQQVAVGTLLEFKPVAHPDTHRIEHAS